MAGCSVSVTVEGMYDSVIDADLHLPLVRRLAAHHFTPAQKVATDAVVVALILVVFHMAPMHASPSRVSGTDWEIIGWAGFVVAAVATLFRRRFPRTALAVVLPVVAAAVALRAGFGVPIYVAMVLYSVVVVSSRRAGLAITGVTAGIFLGACIAGGGDSVVLASIGGVTMLALGWLAGENTQASRVYARQRSERAAEQAAAAEAAQAEQVRLALVEERAQIARELHDIVAHAMSVIAVRSGVARMVIDSDPEQAREALSIIETTTRRSLREMRLLVSVLRDPDGQDAELSPAPGVADIGRLVAAAGSAGVAVELTVDGAVRPLPPAIDLSAYRIVQEALTNVVRHAGPTLARVRLSYQPGEVSIEVTDDGAGGQQAGRTPGAARAGGGHGLIGMRERAALFGGELRAGPHAAGFRVAASIPVSEFRVAEELPVGGVPVAGGVA
jgi:signal transduction histidine kinase